MRAARLQIWRLPALFSVCSSLASVLMNPRAAGVDTNKLVFLDEEEHRRSSCMWSQQTALGASISSAGSSL